MSVTVAPSLLLLHHRKRRLERLSVGVPDYERRHSVELDKIIAALEALA